MVPEVLLGLLELTMRAFGKTSGEVVTEAWGLVQASFLILEHLSLFLLDKFLPKSHFLHLSYLTSSGNFSRYPYS